MSAREIGESIPPASVLVAGIDGSGKSTFLEQLGLLEYIVHEPTVTPMARNFKQASLNRLLDSDFISERESLYLGLNDKFDASIRESLENGRKVATSGNTLVTLLSHTVMRAIVSDSQPEGITKSVINQWLSADCFKPEALVLVHAPESVILERILERQRSGDRAEEFWGFNSPYFLQRYQAEWRQMVDAIKEEVGIICLDFDSGTVSPPEMREIYSRQVHLAR